MLNGALIPSPMNGTPPSRVPTSVIDVRKSVPAFCICTPNCASWFTVENTTMPVAMLIAMSASATTSAVI